FKALIDDRWVKYHPHVGSEVEMIGLLSAARGYLHMSDYENWSLSAHEAAACGLPLLLQDQKWSRERFGGQARYFESIGTSEKNIEQLRRFHADAPNLPAPAVKLLVADEVPVDEQRRDELLEAFQTRHAGSDLDADPDEEPEEYEEEVEELGRED
ncbi:MAG: glycosyltransferase, partial [Solirubrobacteraceae bacterium]